MGYFRECIRLPSFMRFPAITKDSTSPPNSKKDSTVDKLSSKQTNPGVPKDQKNENSARQYK